MAKDKLTKKEREEIQNKINQIRPEVERKIGRYFNELVQNKTKQDFTGEQMTEGAMMSKKGGVRKLKKRRPRTF